MKAAWEGRPPVGPVVHLQKVGGVAGSERHLLALLPQLRERGWNTRMLILHEREPGVRFFVEELERDGVPVDAIALAGDADPAALVRLGALLGRLRPQLLHTHLAHADFYGQLAGAIVRVPVRVSTKHGFDPFRERRAFAAADRVVARMSHKQIAISAGLAEHLAAVEGLSRGAFEIVHYGIVPGDKPPPYESSEPRLLTIGRLIDIKGHGVLLRAFAAARPEVPGLRLDIAGEGPNLEQLRALAAELGVDDVVRFLGWVTPVAPTVEAAAIVVVPSLGEGFGMVALEAMERGRPVIASAVGGLPEIVADRETGLLVPPGQVEPLAAAIVGLASDLSLARTFGAAGRRRAVQEFPQDRCTDRIELLYRELLIARRG